MIGCRIAGKFWMPIDEPLSAKKTRRGGCRAGWEAVGGSQPRRKGVGILRKSDRFLGAFVQDFFLIQVDADQMQVRRRVQRLHRPSPGRQPGQTREATCLLSSLAVNASSQAVVLRLLFRLALSEVSARGRSSTMRCSEPQSLVGEVANVGRSAPVQQAWARPVDDRGLLQLSVAACTHPRSGARSSA